MDEEGVIVEDRDKTRFLCARPGDMLMVPFQCELCHYRLDVAVDKIRARRPYQNFGETST